MPIGQITSLQKEEVDIIICKEREIMTFLLSLVAEVLVHLEALLAASVHTLAIDIFAGFAHYSSLSHGVQY